jgi:cyclopropane-fatty-acyl-phospholipid synthase
MYRGNFSLSLEEAQAQKHDFILRETRLEPGKKLLDIGCGWGGLLTRVRARGGRGVGLTLSSRQADACRKAGLDVRLRDWKTLDRDELGPFDCIASVGAFEHFCSEAEFQEGHQDEIYRAFFELCVDILPTGSRMFLQTMTWGERTPPADQISLNSAKGSDGYIIAVLKRFYPGSWLPRGMDHITGVAAPWFRVVTIDSGRRDYIETMSQWSKRLATPSLAKLVAGARAARYALSDPDFRYRLETAWYSYNQQCFERRLMNHYRMVLEKC